MVRSFRYLLGDLCLQVGMLSCQEGTITTMQAQGKHVCTVDFFRQQAQENHYSLSFGTGKMNSYGVGCFVVIISNSTACATQSVCIMQHPQYATGTLSLPFLSQWQ